MEASWNGLLLTDGQFGHEMQCLDLAVKKENPDDTALR